MKRKDVEDLSAGQSSKKNKDVFQINLIPLSLLDIAPENVRKSMEDDEVSIDNLAQDIDQHGLNNPLTVRVSTTNPERYDIICGQRRFLALCQLKREVAPCRVVACGIVEAEIISLTENIQRSQLPITDKARSINKMYQYFDHDVHKVSQLVSLSAQTVSKYLGLSKLPPHTFSRLDDKEQQLTVTTAHNLSKLPFHVIDKTANAVARLPNDVAKSKAINIIKENPKINVESVVDQVSISLLECIKVVPKVPWMFNRDGQPIVIPVHLYDRLLCIIEQE